jgi:TonB family protein
MGVLYHGFADRRGFRASALGVADFLNESRVRAYLLMMALVRAKALGISLVALILLGIPGQSQAGSYGQIDAFMVRQKIRKDLPKINRCYESALRYEPDLAGKVKVRFAVVRKGYVQGVQVLENTTGNRGVERCVARVVKAIRFPSRRYGKVQRFTFPFVFAPQDAR